ncbi:MAG: NADH-quinone oxidoreductase subunit L [Propionibacteriaceae bacterium]|jgi:NADH-quinone oxidoreductase subunit L|nr:NADH-quinone oxidoreductase subunit L [Propionibacteriaceae bacterium]
MGMNMLLLESGFTRWAGASWLVIALPLLVAAVLLSAGALSDSWGHWLGVAGIAVPFCYSILLFCLMLSAPEPFTSTLYTWLSLGTVKVGVSLLVDQLSILFLLLVTGVGMLVAVYTVGYLAHDAGRRRCFGYINLFIAAMLLLVLADNYGLLFLGWEGVGLASYLLIGFWQERNAAALAAKKAFLMNRVADLGLLTAIAVLFTQAGTLRFSAVPAALQEAGGPWAGIVGVALLLAACGKSAQVPLQSWLLDAMEGPTPVSALIHAATMVTAGVYLMLRSVPVYELAPTVRVVVVLIGVLTLFLGAWIAMTERNLKRVLAGSTMSQVGYLMLAAGLGPVGAVFAVFHLLTHGVFKADLFLTAGAITEAVGFNELRKLGGLLKLLPWTFAAFTCGYLAIIGVPFLSGFYSKEHIIAAAWADSPLLGVCALLGVGLTACYMTRLLLLLFAGKPRWQDTYDTDSTSDKHDTDDTADTEDTNTAADVEIRRTPASMAFPLVVLSLLALVGGLALNGWLQSWLAPVFSVTAPATNWLHFDWLSYTAIGVMLVGVLVAVVWYRKVTPAWFEEPVPAIASPGLYADIIMERGIVAPSVRLTSGVTWLEQRGLDSDAADADGTDGLWLGLNGVSALVLRLQNGSVRTYALLCSIGVVVVLALMLFWVWM